MKLWRLTLAAILGLVLIVPLTAFASVSLFTDVPDTHIFVDDINWMKTAGVTQGCGDGTTYCPEDDVTRGQMAAFMHRLATKRVVDAGTLDGRNGLEYMMHPDWKSKAQSFTIAAGNQATLDLSCPIGKYVVSGGGQSIFKQLVMATSRPLDDNITWRVTWTNTGVTTINTTLAVWAMCAGPGMTIIPNP